MLFVLSRSVHDPDRRDEVVWWWLWWWWWWALLVVDVVDAAVVPTVESPVPVDVLLLLLLLVPLAVFDGVRSCNDVSCGLYSMWAWIGNCNIFCTATRIFSISTWLDGEALRFQMPNISSLYLILITAPQISSLSFFKPPCIANCCPINANIISSQYRDPRPFGNLIIHLPPLVLLGYRYEYKMGHDNNEMRPRT